jgi:hypothetical protein
VGSGTRVLLERVAERPTFLRPTSGLGARSQREHSAYPVVAHHCIAIEVGHCLRESAVHDRGVEVRLRESIPSETMGDGPTRPPPCAPWHRSHARATSSSSPVSGPMPDCIDIPSWGTLIRVAADRLTRSIVAPRVPTGLGRENGVDIITQSDGPVVRLGLLVVLGSLRFAVLVDG